MEPMSKYSELFTVLTPQNQPLVEAFQAKNNAGGYVFVLSPFKRLERFLILGSDTPTYYASARKLTKENAACVIECWTKNPIQTAAMISNVSKNGLAFRNSPAIFATALGMIHPGVRARKWAGTIVKDVCRTSTHLFEFVETCVSLEKGFGRVMKRSVADWYINKTDDQLAYQLVKYRQRNSYTHERLIRLSHPKHKELTPARSAMYEWLRKRYPSEDAYYNSQLPQIIQMHEVWMKAKEEDIKTLPSVSFYNLPWEALPTWANTKPEIWQAMLPKMGLTAMLRNLGNMTRLNVFYPSEIMKNLDRLCDQEELKKAKIHPFQILMALRTYNSGKGFRGSNSWVPEINVSHILETSFYTSFKTIEPSNKRILLALDVSGSMTEAKLMNSNISAREASSAMAMATLRTEENIAIVGFTSLSKHNTGDHISPLQIHKHMSLEEVINYVKFLPFGGTDCALPMLFALEHNLNVDAFVVYTDNETWEGNIHPVEAIRKYREKSGISDAKLIVVGMTSTGFSIADPRDPNMLDVVGFDASAPAIIANFIKGDVSLQLPPSRLGQETPLLEHGSDDQDPLETE